MNQLEINDLNFFEAELSEENGVKGGIAPRLQTPRVSTAVATGVDSKTTTYLKIDGDLSSGFKINSFARGSSASAEASALSLGGTATAVVYVDAG
jgi:hypothetical protein